MYNFFVDDGNRIGDKYFITGGDLNHIKNVLRMKPGDEFLISDGGTGNLCRIESISDEAVTAVIIAENYKNAELPIKIYLFQGLPKADKMELIIQKSVELGAYQIIPVEMKRCVVRLDEKRKRSKLARWQAISESAAKQSKRSIIPSVSEVMSFRDAVETAKTLDLVLVPYENERGMAATKEALSEIKNGMSVGIFIGTEGGFERSEIELAEKSGMGLVSLGERILRTETAAITAVSMCMLAAEFNNAAEKKDEKIT